MALVAGADILAVKGNGNDVETTTSTSETDILDLATSLEIVASSSANLYYQVPVFWDKPGGGNGYTSLRKPVASTDDVWTTSGAIGTDFAKNASASIGDLSAALEEFENARPIAAGFLSQGTTVGTLISSFTAGNETTKFYAEPETAAVGATSVEYVTDAYIRPNEDTYPGWHNGDASGVAYATVAGEEVGETVGLSVTGKTQIFNGFADGDFQRNAAAKAASMEIQADGEVWAQVGVWSWAEGLTGRSWTTLRALVPANGNLADATEWTSSRDLTGNFGVTVVAKNTPTSLDTILDALGDHDVTGYGAFVDAGKTATIQSIEFDNARTDFAKSYTTGAQSVPLSSFAHPKDQAAQTAVYNQWHFDKDHQGTDVTQDLDGLRIPAGGDVLPLEGTGLDGDGVISQDENDIRDLARSLDIEASSTDELYFQVPVFWDKPGGGNGYTSLRKPVASDEDLWTTSGAIGTAFAKDAVASLDELVDAIEQFANARPIAAGFLSYKSSTDTVVSSFTAGGMVSSFAAQPTDTAVTFSVKPVYNSLATAAVSVKSLDDTVPSGSVNLTINGRSYSAELVEGKASVKLAHRLNAGRYATTVTFTSSDPVVHSDSSRSATVTVAKARVKVTAKLADSSIRTKDRAKVAVTVAVPGTLKGYSGKVKYAIYDGSKRVATGSTNAYGKASVKLPKLKAGLHKLVVKASTGANTSASNSSTVKLRVR